MDYCSLEILNHNRRNGEGRNMVGLICKRLLEKNEREAKGNLSRSDPNIEHRTSNKQQRPQHRTSNFNQTTATPTPNFKPRTSNTKKAPTSTVHTYAAAQTSCLHKGQRESQQAFWQYWASRKGRIYEDEAA